MARKRRNSGFWECMTVTKSGCWEWQGYREPNGYGQIRIEKKLHKTHRLAFELTYGYSPEVVCHHCDNPPCCNPAHLFGGTHADNVADKIAKGRGRCGNLRGEAVGGAKLTAADIPSIRAALAHGETQTSIARRYGITQSAVWRIAKNQTWRHV